MSQATIHGSTGERPAKASKYDRTLDVWPIRSAADYRRAARELDLLEFSLQAAPREEPVWEPGA